MCKKLTRMNSFMPILNLLLLLLEVVCNPRKVTAKVLNLKSLTHMLHELKPTSKSEHRRPTFKIKSLRFFKSETSEWKSPPLKTT